ncbi:hypothetical protein J1G42_01490 [Cellulomonas sp. zg-ZUI222]|uniref:Uncharacterized protein n=1 Tax=Cellulomonas wangleii TaxID=2816956 RepID=A0ABX8D7B3_9CELL|nr:MULTISPECIES: hypothetical protein [Cellulomonas]MBO0898633.1 hypothetical protein [Cellulomonas sp. zg-ZUI22]MBO0919495.1 hypothetical protein [Cellulomonas wangleii]MBO0924365.1 hypothetical protein [Cellulomonas wangleii]QVI62366.1 hypothetical protein KG103_18530 [Cellulomonas wangleii]
MTDQRPTPRLARFRPADLWAAVTPVGFVLLLLGQNDATARGTGLVVGAIACFAVGVAAVAVERGRRRSVERA